MDEVQGLQFTARRLGVQLDLLIQALEKKRPTDEIKELCREAGWYWITRPRCSGEWNE